MVPNNTFVIKLCESHVSFNEESMKNWEEPSPATHEYRGADKQFQLVVLVMDINPLTVTPTWEMRRSTAQPLV